MFNYRQEQMEKQSKVLRYFNMIQGLPRFKDRLYHIRGMLKTFFVPDSEIEEFERYFIGRAKKLVTESVSELTWDDDYRGKELGPEQLTQIYLEIFTLESGESYPSTKAQRAYLSVMAKAVSEKMADIATRYSMPELPRSVERFLQNLLNPPQPQEIGTKFFDQLSKTLQDKLLLANVPQDIVDQYLNAFKLYRGTLTDKYGTEVDAVESKKQEKIRVGDLTEMQRSYMMNLLAAEQKLSEHGITKYGKKTEPQQQEGRSPLQNQMDELFKDVK